MRVPLPELEDGVHVSLQHFEPLSWREGEHPADQAAVLLRVAALLLRPDLHDASILVSATRDRHRRGRAVNGPGWSRIARRLPHFRTSAGREVDLVVEDARGRLVGTEVEASTAVTADDLRGLEARTGES